MRYLDFVFLFVEELDDGVRTADVLDGETRVSENYLAKVKPMLTG